MKYILSILFMFWALLVNAQNKTADTATLQQLQERLAKLEQQNEALKAELDSVKLVDSSIIMTSNELNNAMSSICSETDSLLTQAKIYADTREKAVDWSFHIGTMDWIVGIGIGIIAILVGFFSFFQINSLRELTKKQVEIENGIIKIKNSQNQTAENIANFERKQKQLDEQIEFQNEKNKKTTNQLDTLNRMFESVQETSNGLISAKNNMFIAIHTLCESLVKNKPVTLEEFENVLNYHILLILANFQVGNYQCIDKMEMLRDFVNDDSYDKYKYVGLSFMSILSKFKPIENYITTIPDEEIKHKMNLIYVDITRGFIKYHKQ